MIESVFTIGWYQQSPFGVFMVLAFLGAGLQLRSNFRLLGIGSDDDPSLLLFWGALGGIAGGKIYFAILNGDPSLLLERFGFVWYGGFVLGAAAVLLAMRRRQLPLARSADAAAPAMALGYAIGRVGCLLVGDDYGVPTDVPWGLRFPVGLPPTTAGSLRSTFGLEIPPEIANDTLLAVHPTQAYETIAALVIWGIGLWSLRKLKEPGATVLLVLGLLGLERFAVEFLRAKDDRFLSGFTLAQLLSVVLMVVVTLLAVRLRSRRSAEGAA
jgi:phosphatidylglycerol:prolipoprotein diacylglycerol transferase